MPSYPSPPGNRFQLDADGTQVFIRQAANTLTALTTGQVTACTGMDGGVSPTGANFASNGQTAGLVFLFPEARTIAGLLWACGDASGSTGSRLQTPTVWYSTDTTDGLNGNWTQVGTTGNYYFGDTPSNDNATYRTSIAAVSLTGVKGIELRVQHAQNGASSNPRWWNVNLYGSRATTGDHLQLWHPTADTPLAAPALDFGDIGRGVQQTARQFRIKNTSATATASAITVAYSDYAGLAFGGTGGQVSADNTTWAASISLSNLGPGAISPVTYVRLNSLATSAPAPKAGRVKAAASGVAGDGFGVDAYVTLDVLPVGPNAGLSVDAYSTLAPLPVAANAGISVDAASVSTPSPAKLKLWNGSTWVPIKTYYWDAATSTWKPSY